MICAPNSCYLNNLAKRTCRLENQFLSWVSSHSMSWITVIWSMVASACLTLEMVHLLVWWRRRDEPSDMLFAVAATATALVVACELWMMRAGSTEEFGVALRWLHVPVWLLIVSLVGQMSLLLLAAFVADATLVVSHWGDQRQALFLGGPIIFFTIASTGQAVCRSIVTVHGGKLCTANNPERGATSCFSLPVSGGRGNDH